jgi:hypothetical protein
MSFRVDVSRSNVIRTITISNEAGFVIGGPEGPDQNRFYRCLDASGGGSYEVM